MTENEEMRLIPMPTRKTNKSARGLVKTKIYKLEVSMEHLAGLLLLFARARPSMTPWPTIILTMRSSFEESNVRTMSTSSEVGGWLWDIG